jgi:acyl-CoA reductase-like NAD-dependent aldehyde dehydrogenase
MLSLSGIVNTNDHGALKQSGVGVEHSKHGLYSWVNIQSLTLNRALL